MIATDRRMLILICLASACAKAPALQTHEFQSQLDTFRNEAEARGILVATETVEIEVVDKLSTVALCTKSSPPRISLRKDFLTYDKTPEHLEMILFHELGHCLLNKGHDRPYTIMAVTQFPLYEDYKVNRKAYLDQYFGGN